MSVREEPTARRERIERVGDEICALSAHIAAATCRWLLLVATFDRDRGWAHWGCRSMAHWLNWRCGVDLRTAREHVRVARCLESLPKITESFAAGEISFSKVRAMTRIATPDNETELLMLARHGTAAHVEKVVRCFRKADGVTVARALHQQRERHVRYYWDWDGSLVVSARLPAETGAVVLQALKAADEQLRKAETDGSAEPPEDHPPLPEPTDEWARRQADALVAVADGYLGGSGARSGADRYQVVVHVDAEALGPHRHPGRCELDADVGLSNETARRLACDASIVAVVKDSLGQVLDVGRKTRSIPPSVRRGLDARQSGCAFPGCTFKGHLHAHHIRHWADGGPTSLANLVLLCSYHHRLVHEGGFVLRRAGPDDDRLVFARPDGTTLETAPFRTESAELERLNTSYGLRIDAMTPVPRWYGERCDYDMAVDGLMAASRGP